MSYAPSVCLDGRNGSRRAVKWFIRQVFTGHAVTDDSAYRHCWVVRFATRPVIDSYREHPAQQNFADNRFRPHAGTRLSIDFEACSTEKQDNSRWPGKAARERQVPGVLLALKDD